MADRTTATSGTAGSDATAAVNLTNLSGMDGRKETSLHSTEAAAMWSTADIGSTGAPTSDTAYVDFNLRMPYTIGKAAVWNYNAGGGTAGLKDISIYYSLNGKEYAKAKDVTLAQSAGESAGKAQIIDLDSIQAQYIRIVYTPTSSGNYGAQKFGLSEVMFKKINTIVGVEPCSVTTTVGKMPSLPETVTVKYQDGTKGDAAVTWDTAGISDKLTVATPFKVNGDVEGTTLKAACTVNVVYDKSALLAAIDQANKLEGLQVYYTADSWNAMQEKLKQAKAVYDNASATQAAVDGAEQELSSALKALQESGYTTDKSALRAVIDQIGQLKEENYTAASWGKLQTALQAAIAVRDDISRMLQETIDKAAQDLRDARNSLVRRSSDVNLALNAKATANVVAGWNKVAAVNDDFVTETSADLPNNDQTKTYGNWGQINDTNPTAIVTLTWNEAVTLNASDIFFFDDRGTNTDPITSYGGVAVPVSYKYEYLKEDGTWADVPNASGLKNDRDMFNRTTFDSISTKAIRVTMDRNKLATGIIEWRAFSIVPAEVDYAVLDAAIASVNELKQSYYTEDSWLAVQKAAEAAAKLKETAGATQAQVDAAAYAVNDAVAALVFRPADKAQLTAKLDEAKLIDLAKYTESTAQALRDAIDAAKALADDASLTAADQEKIDGAVMALNHAIQALVLSPADKTQLTAKLAEAKAVDLTKYTELTAKVLSEAVTAAEQLAADTSLTVNDQAKVDAAVKALDDAIKALVLIPEFNPVKLVDDATGIVIEGAAGVIPADTRLVVTQILQGERFDAVKQFLNEKAQQFTLFDISLLSGGKVIEPNGEVRVTVPIPAGYDSSRIALYHIADDGTAASLDFTIQDGKLVFTAGSFSLYAIAEIKNGTDSQPDSSASSAQTESGSAGIPTGEAPVTPLIALIIMAAAAMLLVYKRQTKYSR